MPLYLTILLKPVPSSHLLDVIRYLPEFALPDKINELATSVGFVDPALLRLHSDTIPEVSFDLGSLQEPIYCSKRIVQETPSWFQNLTSSSCKVKKYLLPLFWP